MAFNAEDAVEDLLLLYGESDLEIVRTLIGSRTLREAARLVVDAQAGAAAIIVPHYWAVYYHDGREGFAAPAGHFLVYFANEADDPRLEGGRPETIEQVRHLTREEFEAGLSENQTRAEDGDEPFMFVVRSVGPQAPHPFFEQLTQGAAERMDQFAEFALDAYVQEQVDEEGPERSTARVRL